MAVVPFVWCRGSWQQVGGALVAWNGARLSAGETFAPPRQAGRGRTRWVGRLSGHEPVLHPGKRGGGGHKPLFLVIDLRSTAASGAGVVVFSRSRASIAFKPNNQSGVGPSALQKRWQRHSKAASGQDPGDRPCEKGVWPAHRHRSGNLLRPSGATFVIRIIARRIWTWSRKDAFSNEKLTKAYHVWVVHGEHLDGDSSDRCLTDQYCPIIAEVVIPLVPTWVEEANELRGGTSGVNAADVRSFVPVTVDARKREVAQDGFPAVLQGDDVVDCKGEETTGLWDVAILADVLGPFPNSPCERLIHER